MNYLSLLIPFAYLGILLTSLATFSSLYRKRKAQKSLNLSPYFPAHTARDMYLTLLHLSDDEGAAAKVPDSLLRAALLARCTEDIHRIVHIRTRKQALNTLLKRGCVGDDIWQRLLRAEAELELEVKDCVQEANAFSPNWGATIFQSANEMANNDMLKQRLEGIFASLPAEKSEWERRRQRMREGFLRELEAGAAADSRKESLAAAAAAAAAGRGSSDEDAVIVDAAASSSVGAGGGGKGKKKKGKK